MSADQMAAAFRLLVVLMFYGAFIGVALAVAYCGYLSWRDEHKESQ